MPSRRETTWLVGPIGLIIGLLLLPCTGHGTTRWFEFASSLGHDREGYEEQAEGICLTEEQTPIVPGLGVPLSDLLTVAANFDGSYRNTQFYRLGHNSVFFQWDARAELWLPPFRSNFSWGPYFRLAGITSNRTVVWENAWLARPGVGIQAYPFSFKMFQKPEDWIGKVLSPTRFFAEYNHLHYWGGQPWWRPDRHVRAGAEYWKEINTNNTDKRYWTEVWWGLTWQSIDEWNIPVNNVIFGASGRFGLRTPKAGILSMISPYFVMESSLTENEKSWWENRMLMGGGVRFSPPINCLRKWMSRFAVFAETVAPVAYYRYSDPSYVPEYDIRAGISISIGEWFH